jgi:hypothetical protein
VATPICGSSVFAACRAVGLAKAGFIRVPLRVHSRLLSAIPLLASSFRPIRSALPAGYAVLIEMNYQEPLLGKGAVEGNKLLGFA